MVKDPRVVCIIQARMGSTRLPGKSMMPLHGTPMIGHVVGRAARMVGVNDLVVATSFYPEDDAIAHYCEGLCEVYRGSPHDVLARFHDAAARYQADAVVRVTADCPFLDPNLAEALIWRVVRARIEYASNCHPVRSFPDGLDLEVFPMHMLEQANRLAYDGHDREHVTPWIKRKLGPRSIYCAQIAGENLGHVRWTVDTADDYEKADAMMRQIATMGYGMNWGSTMAAAKEIGRA